MSSPPARGVLVVGAGKVGRALRRALREAGAQVSLRAARRGPARRVDASLVIFAVRDPALPATAAAWAAAGVLGAGQVALHCAGSQGPEVLAPLAACGVAVAQFHPLVAFASAGSPPPLRGAGAHVAGDPEAVREARRLARRLGMRAVTIPQVDRALYHAGAALLANGAVGLAAAAAELLAAAGCSEAQIPKLLGPLLASVAHNLEHLGLPDALTGPVRRGDAQAIAGHRARIAAAAPHLDPLYCAAAGAQLPLAAALGEADDLPAVARALQPKRPKRRKR